MLYFAYGSNMDPNQMRDRCPDSTLFGVGVLSDHELCFPRLSKTRGCGVASVRRNQTRNVWGVVYEVSDADLVNLDKSEGFNADRVGHLNSYNRLVTNVTIGGEPYDVLIYIAQEQQKQPLPSLAYLTHLRSGARHHELPNDYIAYLEALPHK